MARTAITAQSPTQAGAAITLEAANVAGNSIDIGAGPRLLWVKNGSGGSINVTIPTVATVGGLTIADRVVAVGAGAEKIIRVSDAQVQADGLVYVNYSAVTSVTIASLAA